MSFFDRLAKTPRWLVLALLGTYYFLFFCQKTVFTASDLGRHLMNGRVIWETGHIFTTNLYSYTQPDRFVPNHHWLFGLSMYEVQAVSGFAGLTLISALIYTSAVLIPLFLISREIGKKALITTALIVLPLITFRNEVRPEAFSLLFFSLQFFLLQLWKEGKIKTGLVALFLSLTTILWVNTHIFFFLSSILVGSFGVEMLVQKKWTRVKELCFIGVLVLLSTLCNPLGLQGALYPFSIFGEYGYMVAENQSPFFFFKYHQSHPIHGYIIALSGVVSLAVLWRARKDWKNQLAVILLNIFFTISTLILIRFSNFLGVIALVLLAPLISSLFATVSAPYWQKRLKKPITLSFISFISFCSISVLLALRIFTPLTAFSGVGLSPGVEDSALFYRSLGITGPIFNNFDIGGYLIYYLYPSGQKVFVDNRAEAYSADFFAEYIAVQTDPEFWEKLDDRYHFSTIYFYRHDLTTRAQDFLFSVYKDPNWVPIYFDDYAIIFLKDTPDNAAAITKYRLPDELFHIAKDRT
ncbi:hypothetical protein KA082_02420 [Candidatus Woesebacteria bacterium]|nr:hypothetical protein [Candidatus Woesebacteria bacterium]